MNESSERTIGVSDVALFYDQFNSRLLRDYVKGNDRVAAAIQRVTAVIGPETRNLLDVGCGIGATTFAFKSAAPWVNATGVDISSVNIDVARKLFAENQISFEVSTMETPPNGGPFDVIALIDVYEHIPRSDWKSFNQILSRSLSDDGRIVLTTPSPLHQQYLRDHKPDGLQIIDETVELSDIAELAQQTESEVTHFQWVTIWQTNDYAHAVLERRPRFERPKRLLETPHNLTAKAWNKICSRLARNSHSAEVKQRQRHVQERLGILVE